MPASELVGVRTREALREFILGCSPARRAGGAGGRGPALDRRGLACRARRDRARPPPTSRCCCSAASVRNSSRSGRCAVAADLRLSALTNVIATEIIRERLEGRALPEELVRLGVAKSEGNPLFAEEFAHYLSHKGAQREHSGDAAFTRHARPRRHPDAASKISSWTACTVSAATRSGSCRRPRCWAGNSP